MTYFPLKKSKTCECDTEYSNSHGSELETNVKKSNLQHAFNNWLQFGTYSQPLTVIVLKWGLIVDENRRERLIFMEYNTGPTFVQFLSQVCVKRRDSGCVHGGSELITPHTHPDISINEGDEMHVYVRMYIYIYAYIRIYLYIHTYTSMYIHIYIHVYVYIKIGSKLNTIL